MMLAPFRRICLQPSCLRWTDHIERPRNGQSCHLVTLIAYMFLGSVTQLVAVPGF